MVCTCNTPLTTLISLFFAFVTAISIEKNKIKLFLQYWSHLWPSKKFLCSSSILSCQLSPYRKSKVMPHSSITLNFLKSFDCRSNLPLEIILQNILLQFIRDQLLLFFWDFTYFLHIWNVKVPQDFPWSFSSNSINHRQRNPNRFFFWKNMPHQSKHLSKNTINKKLSLPSFMSRIFLTCHIKSSFSLYNLTVHTSFLQRSYYFHFPFINSI